MKIINIKRGPILALLIGTISSSAIANTETSVDESLYKEPLRPQYHFTPAHRWIGDPCGLVYADSIFHVYSWGGAESSDLIHWKEINNHAIKNMPPKSAAFTGSVVVDRENTAGYGDGAYIATFTLFDEDSKKQSQAIAFSRDKGRTYQFYDQNPVLDEWSTEFRDPTVIRDDANGQWVMVVAKALNKKIGIYGSKDLIHWEWLSDFGPMGDTEKSWECPDLFQVTVDGDPQKKKWVMVISVNWAREQYFVGEFNGKEFIPDNPNTAPLYVDEGLDYYASRTFQDYEGNLPGVYSIGWVSTWDYAQHVPTEYGKGVWSMPRELTLVTTPEGLRLVQQPYSGILSLRGKPFFLNRQISAGITSLPQVAKMDNTYEIVADIDASRPDVVGFNLCVGKDCKAVLSYDTRSHTLTLDRTQGASTEVTKGKEIPKFDRMAFTKVKPGKDNRLNLDIFVDKSLIEVYAENGEHVMTALIFPSEDAQEAEIFSMRGKARVDLTVYPMSSIWEERFAQIRPK